MGKVILRRLAKGTEKYEYFQCFTDKGIVLITCSKEHATVFNEGESLFVVNSSKDEPKWETVRYRQRLVKAQKVNFKKNRS